jgi:hypothetical protein
MPYHLTMPPNTSCPHVIPYAHGSGPKMPPLEDAYLGMQLLNRDLPINLL